MRTHHLHLACGTSIDYARPCEPLVKNAAGGAQQTGAAALTWRLRLERGHSAIAIGPAQAIGSMYRRPLVAAWNLKAESDGRFSKKLLQTNVV